MRAISQIAGGIAVVFFVLAVLGTWLAGHVAGPLPGLFVLALAFGVLAVWTAPRSVG